MTHSTRYHCRRPCRTETANGTGHWQLGLLTVVGSFYASNICTSYCYVTVDRLTSWTLFITHVGGHAGGIAEPWIGLSVESVTCLCVRALKGKKAWAIDNKHCSHTLHGSRSACVDHEDKVNSQGHVVTKCAAGMCRLCMSIGLFQFSSSLTSLGVQQKGKVYGLAQLHNLCINIFSCNCDRDDAVCYERVTSLSVGTSFSLLGILVMSFIGIRFCCVGKLVYCTACSGLC